MQLLQRYYDTDGGAVLVDGHDTTKTNTKFLRSNIGIVAQEPTLFDATIGENIAYGALHKKITQEDIIRASTIASLHDFVKDMPEGYDTPAGLLSIYKRGYFLHQFFYTEIFAFFYIKMFAFSYTIFF